MQVSARNNYLTVKLEDKQDVTTEGGVLLPGFAQEDPDYMVGEVTSIGPEAEGFKEGERVVISKFAGQTVTLSKERFRMVLDKDIFGVLVD